MTAFHTPDGIMCFNRLVMGAQPSSAVQQSAYLQALDDYLDIDEEDNARVDSNGTPLHLRRRFAIYCDDIAAGADTIPELYVMFEALISALHRAGIQVKAAKVKFGVRKVTSHNYTITANRSQT